MKIYPVLHTSSYFLNQPKIRNIQQVWKTIIKWLQILHFKGGTTGSNVKRNNTMICWYSSHTIALFRSKEDFRMNVPLNVLFWCYFPHWSLPMKWCCPIVMYVQLNSEETKGRINQCMSKWMPLAGSVCFLSFSWRKFGIRWTPCERPTNELVIKSSFYLFLT